MMYIVQALGFKKQGNSWAYFGCSWRWWCGLWCDSFLSDGVYYSYNSYKTVSQHIHICVIILGPLHHWWGTWFKLLLPKIRGTYEHVWGVVGGDTVVCGVMRTFQKWHTSNLPHTKQCDRISIYVSLYLDHYTTDVVHGSSSWVWKPM